MRDIDLGPVSPPEGADPDLVTFGPEPPGEEPSGGRRGWPPARWRPAGWVPARWRGRPVPRSVVAVVSAVVAGAAVAGYLDRPAADPARATEPAPLLAPESWLDVTDDPAIFPLPLERGSEADRQRVAQATAAHPAEAVLVLPLPRFRHRLTGLPPGTYQVRASCALAEQPESLSEPLRYTVALQEPAGPDVYRTTFRCDGQVRTASEPLTVDGYRAFFSGLSFPFENPIQTPGESPVDPDFIIDNHDPLAVISFTEV